jgi:hypothetical protein
MKRTLIWLACMAVCYGKRRRPPQIFGRPA